MKEKLSLRYSLQWLILKLLKTQPMTTEEIYEELGRVLPPPPDNGKSSRSYSRYNVGQYVKQLCALNEIIEVPGKVKSYSITRDGHLSLKEREKDLFSRLKVVKHSLEVMLDYVTYDRSSKAVQIVPVSDREFTRSLISMKDLVRFYILDELAKQPNQSMSQLMQSMLQTYGWTCSKQYFHIVGRNELTEGLNDKDEPLDEDVPILLKSKREVGKTRNLNRLYSIIDLDEAHSWKERFRTDGADSLRKGLKYVNSLMNERGM